MLRKSFFLLSFFLLFLAHRVSAQELNGTDLNSRIAELIPEAVNDTTPGLVIGVVVEDELWYAQGFGLANLSYGIPNDPKMVYNIGSVSKQFLGYAFAMLHVEGKLNLDDPVSKYLEDWPEFDEVVTLRQLLSHTSGYREAYTMSSLAGRAVGVDRITKDECLEVVRRQPELEYSPGSQFTYNSTAYVILSKVLEEVTETPADIWVTENMLKPLGLNDTQIESEVGEVIKNAAESYYFENGLYINSKSNRAIFGAGDICTSVLDLMKWMKNYKTAEVGGEEVNQVFLETFELTDGSDSKYALGIFVDEYRGAKRYRHAGSHESFITQLTYFPEYDLGIAMVSNYGRSGVFSDTQIADLLLEEYLEPIEEENVKAIKVKTARLMELEGFYMADDYSDWVDLVMVDDTLTVDRRNKLLPISKFEFAVLNRNKNMTVNQGADPSYLTFSDEPQRRYEKAEKWEPSIGELKLLEGQYWCEELEALYHMEVADSSLVISSRWKDPITLNPIYEELFSSNQGFNLRMIRNDVGEIEGFRIDSRRTKNVVFKKAAKR
jgi:CubicO group peptidase (beta-lactamase class C family)